MVETATHSITIGNQYTSNGFDNYADEIFVNFRFEATGWFWYYEMGNRKSIFSGQSHTWVFELPVDRDSIYIHARFWYSEGPEYLAVQADTSLRLISDLVLVFRNCADSTVTDYPFAACWAEGATIVAEATELPD
ncbi:MAG: hypothetical protein ABIA75_08655 [Candidatus Neomarinimicrobiota bacterium]